MTAVVDHVVLATSEVDITATELEQATGIATEIGGHHVGLGTWNRLVSFDDGRYLEIIGPDPTQPTPASPRPFGIDTIRSTSSARVATMCVRPVSLEVAIDAAARVGITYGAPQATSRQSPAGLLTWRLSFPSDDGGGAIPFLIDWGDTPHPSQTVTGGLRLERLQICHPDNRSITDLFEAIGLDVDVANGDAGCRATFAGPAGEFTPGG
ncbi:MAG: VOC family protein [Ilumatobacteraceae bacterium]